jgi:3-isopropylmalate dehydrogenase
LAFHAVTLQGFSDNLARVLDGGTAGMTNHKTVLLMGGDGIGPEVTEQGARVLSWFADRRGLPLHFEEDLYGGACFDRHGVFVRDATVIHAGEVDAVLCGASGGPKWDDLPQARPKAGMDGLTRMRRELDLFANIRPSRCLPALENASTLKAEVIRGVDLIVLRELTSGIYYGEPRGIEELPDGRRRGVDTQIYSSDEIERVVRQAFELARDRRGIVHSVEKSNVMETGILWREVASQVHADEFPDLTLHHMLTDNCAMQLVRDPRQFDVIVTDNLFGDLLSDASAMLMGSLGMLPSASLGPARGDGRRAALYEPVHGSAPDIASQGLANPLASILSVAMMLRLSLDAPEEAAMLERAVEAALDGGARTSDLAAPGESTVSTPGMGDAVIAALEDLI